MVIKPVFRIFYCSRCHISHRFERIADMWVSRQDCGKTMNVRPANFLSSFTQVVCHNTVRS